MSWQMWDSPFAQPATAALLHFIWQGGVLGLAAHAALRLATQARTRYAIACGALVAMALAPAVTLWMSIPDAPVSVYPPGGNGILQTGAADLPIAPAAFEWRQFVLPLWLVGVVLLGVRALGGWSLAVRQIRRDRTRAPHEIEDSVRAIAKRFGVERAIRVFMAARASVPAAFGWLRPVLLVPVSAMTGLGPDALRAILAHEVAHIARHDFAVNCLQSALEVLLFYHPAVWWVSRRIREEREVCCDAMAVELCGDPVRYSRALLALEEGRQRYTLAANGGSLKHRVERLLLEEQPAGSYGIAAAGILAVVCCGVAVSVGFAIPKPPAPAPAPVEGRVEQRVVKQAAKKVGSRRAIPAGAHRPAVFIMSREQQDEYVLLPDDIARDAFIERFWESRTPAERAEHEARVRKANERFAEATRPGWDTPRGRTYLKDGPPDEIESHPGEHREIWRYNTAGRTYTFSGYSYDNVRIEFAGGAGGPGSKDGKLINYSTPKKSVQYIVIDIAAQVGLGYNWEKSFAQTNPECRKFAFNVSIRDLPFEKAMAKILDPVKLRYEIEAGKVVLYRK